MTPFAVSNEPVETIARCDDNQGLEERIKELERELQLKDEACRCTEKKLCSAERQVHTFQCIYSFTFRSSFFDIDICIGHVGVCCSLAWGLIYLCKRD